MSFVVSEQKLIEEFKTVNSSFIVIYFKDFIKDNYNKLLIKPLSGKIIESNTLNDLTLYDMRLRFPEMKFIKASRGLLPQSKNFSNSMLKLIIDCNDEIFEFEGKTYIYHKCRVMAVKRKEINDEVMKEYENSLRKINDDEFNKALNDEEAFVDDEELWMQQLI